MSERVADPFYALNPAGERLRLRRIHHPKRAPGSYSMLEPPVCAECGVMWSRCRVFGVGR